MTKYQIPVTYKSWGLVEIEADSLEEATELSLKGSLPIEPEYIEDSLEVDRESVFYLNSRQNTPPSKGEG